MRWEMDDKFGLPVVVVKQIEVLAKNVSDNRIDALIIFIGGERMGKSTLQTRVALCFAHFMKTDLKLQRDYFYDQTEYINACLNTTFADNEGKPFPKKGGEHHIKVYDEPVLGMNARKWATEGNVLINQMFSIIGFKYMVLLASFPSWWMLDNMAREHRVAALFRVYGKIGRDGWVNKGYFKLYNGEMARKIYKQRETGRTVFPRTKYVDMRFESMEGTKLWKEYEEFSPKAKMTATQALLTDLMNLKHNRFKTKKEADLNYIDKGD